MNTDHVAIECEHDETERAARRVAGYIRNHQHDSRQLLHAWEWKALERAKQGA